MSKFGKGLIESANQAVAIAKGEMKPGRVFEGSSIDVAAIRKSMGLSQVGFAEKFNLSPATVRDWEQKRRQPDGPAENLLRVIASNPEAVEAALARKDR
jgi:putative transcriptional regulator